MARERSGSPWATREEGSLLLALVGFVAARFGPLLRLFGVDPRAFRELLHLRVVLALRPSREASAWGTAGLALALVMTWVAGLGTGLIALLNEDAALWVVISHSALGFLLALMLFQYAAGILVDPSDIAVVAPHPVGDRTVFAVRLAEVAAYLALFTLAFTGGNVLLAVFGQPPLAVLLFYPVLSVVCAASTLGLVALLFALVLCVVGPAHFQRVTLWVQILGGVALFGALQAPRFVHPEQWGLWADELARWRAFWPPYGYAAWFELASTGHSSAPLAALVAAVLLAPLALLVTFALAARAFLAGLQGPLGAPRPRASWPEGRTARTARLLTRTPSERAGFEFAAALSRREPHFLRAVLPQLAMFQFMALAMGFGRHREVAMFLPLSPGLLFMLLPNVLVQAQSTPTPAAAGLFASAPLASRDEFLRGGVKALLWQWVGAPAVALFCVQLVLVGLEGLPRILLAFELAFAVTLFFAPRYALALPFTRPIRVGETGAQNFGLILVSGLAMAAVWLAHWLLTRHALVQAASSAALALLLVVLWRDLARVRVRADA
jgi:hypothetical protein